MNINKITEICNNPLLSEENKHREIIKVIALDKNAIPDLLEVLKSDREQNRDLISDMNLQLSRAHIFIEEYTPAEIKLKKGEKPFTFDRKFVLDKIAEFYIANKNKIRHLFNRFN